MKVLGIETATPVGSVALVDGRGLRAEFRLAAPRVYTEALIGEVARLLREESLRLEDLDGYAISIGPGSFTGIRVGLATVKGLARACPKPTAVVSTLEALAWQGRQMPNRDGRLLCSVLDARQQHVFAALYRWEGEALRCIMPPAAMRPEALRDLIVEPTLFLGPGADLYPMLWESPGALGRDASPGAIPCSAAAVAECGAEQLRNGEGRAASGVVPMYLRRAVAVPHPNPLHGMEREKGEEAAPRL